MVEEFIIKFAAIDDMKDVFDLSNDDLVRQNSFNQEKIDWENHQKWFKNKLRDENCIFIIIRDFNNNLISQIRFDKINDAEGDISISISPDFRGKGYGTKVLKAVSEKIISEQKIKKINAYVKNENIASKTIFEKAGYILMEKDSNKVRYEYSAE